MRHPLNQTGNDNTEKTVKWIIDSEHAVILERIQEETQKDPIAQRIAKAVWEKHKTDREIEPFLHVKKELSVAEGLIFRENRIVLPGHKLGHLGRTKTKQMLRQKYWFPLMNSIIDTTVDQCYECKVTTEDHREEPIKVTTMPSKPWSTVALDHGGPYPDGHYNLVMIDKRTRYPVVEAVPSTNFEVNKGRLKHIFATYGTPRRIETDNGPPFSSKEFKEFGKKEGFEHHKITPLHPRANGEAERFMQTLNKVERIAHLQEKNRYERQNAIQDMLVAYRSTPHPATEVAPYDAMRGCIIRTKLDHVEPKEGNVEGDDQIRRKDATYKQKMKKQREGKQTREAALLLGYYVLVKQPKKNEWTTPYKPVFYVVREIRGSQITARRITDG